MVRRISVKIAGEVAQVRIPSEFLEGYGADRWVRCQRVPLQVFGKVLESSGVVALGFRSFNGISFFLGRSN